MAHTQKTNLHATWKIKLCNTQCKHTKHALECKTETLLKQMPADPTLSDPPSNDDLTCRLNQPALELLFMQAMENTKSKPGRTR